MESINLKTEIVNGEINITLVARLEDWETVKDIVDSVVKLSLVRSSPIINE